VSIEADFLTIAVETLETTLEHIEASVSKLPPHALWARSSENENAAGNLLLHLEGNVRQWILSGVGGASDTRDRASEFAARSGQDASALVAALRRTVEDAMAVIGALPHARLGESVRIQGYDTTVLSAIFHVVEHFSGHAGQIILLTKQATGQDLGFYGYLSRTGHKDDQPDESA